MKYKNILVAGGAGFVGSNLALKLKAEFHKTNIFVMDNLKRRGSELNIKRMKDSSVTFVHGDIRNKEDFNSFSNIDLILECSAEPSVLAGINESPDYLINTNLVGSINCMELARKTGADFIFFSTSRVYPISMLNDLKTTEGDTRFILEKKQSIVGASEKGVAENFPIEGARSLYGATKYCSEIILKEYIESYGINGIVNRCGVITGPWQMGKIDQGVFVLWIARHFWKNKELSYIGYNGTGKQVRDFIHIDDLYEVLKIQLSNMKKYNNNVYNIGGGNENSISLLEMTKLCEEISGNKIKINQVKENRQNDVRIYVSDCEKFKKASGWRCKKDAKRTFEDIYRWIRKNKDELESVLN